MKVLGFNIEISRHAAPAALWKPTHVHKKGGKYRQLYEGVLEADMSPVVIYDGSDGVVWVRPHAEFHDGRFRRIE